MNRDCSKCKYHDDERDMGGGSFIVCDHPKSTSSWPDICPLDAVEIIKQFRDRQGNSSEDIEALEMAINAIELVNNYKGGVNNENK